jgi:hypothetical protein
VENSMQLVGMMEDAQLDAVVGGCGGYKYPSRDSHEDRRHGSRRKQQVASDNNIIVVDDININADDGAKVFVTFVQDN